MAKRRLRPLVIAVAGTLTLTSCGLFGGNSTAEQQLRSGENHAPPSQGRRVHYGGHRRAMPGQPDARHWGAHAVARSRRKARRDLLGNHPRRML